MRRTLATIVILGLPALAAAQSSTSALSTLPPLPPIGLPLPQIGLPLPQIGLPPAPETPPRDIFGQPRQGTSNQRRNGRSGSTVIWFVPTLGWGYYPPQQAATPGATVPDPPAVDRRPAVPTGRLRLELKADGALQLYVDDYYVGSPDDFNGELELEAGPHKIEIRAPEYETLTFDVKIAAEKSITYRGTLKPLDTKRAEAAPEPPPATPSTFYFIPGCYLGNVPPEDVALPAGCDLTRLIVRKP